MMEGKTPAFLVLSSEAVSCPKQQINLTTGKWESSFGDVYEKSSIDSQALLAYAKKINKRPVESETNSINNTQLPTTNIKLSPPTSQKTNKNDESKSLNFNPPVKPMAHSLPISIPLEKVNFSRKKLKETGILKEAFNTKTEKIPVGAKNNSFTVSSKKDNIFKSHAEQKRLRQKKRPSRHSTVAISCNLRSSQKKGNDQQTRVLHVLSEDLMLSSTSDSDASLNNNPPDNISDEGGKVVPEDSLFLDEMDICQVNNLVIASKLPAHHNLMTSFSEKFKPTHGKNGFNVNSETYHCDIYETPFHLTNSNGYTLAGSQLSEDTNKTSPLQSNSLSSSPTIDAEMSLHKNDSDLESGLSDLNLENSLRKEVDDKASDSTVELNDHKAANQISSGEKIKLTTEAAELKAHYESYDHTFQEEIVSESDDSSIENDHVVHENLEIIKECKVSLPIICNGTEMPMDCEGNNNSELTPCTVSTTTATSWEKKVESSLIEVEQLDYEPFDSPNENSSKDESDFTISNSNLIGSNVELDNSSLTKSHILEKPSTQPPLEKNANSHVKWTKDTILKDLVIAENKNNNLPLDNQSKDIQLIATQFEEPLEYSSDEIELQVHPDSLLYEEYEQESSNSRNEQPIKVPSLKDSRSENLLESVKTLVSQESFAKALNEIKKAEEEHPEDFEPSLEFLIQNAFKNKRVGFLKSAFDVFRRSFSKIKSLDVKRSICEIFILISKVINNAVPMIKSLFDLIRKNEPKVILVKDSFDIILRVMLKGSKPDWRFIMDALEFSMEHCKNDPHINTINAVLKAAKQYPCNIFKRVSHLIINVMEREWIAQLNEENLRSFCQILNNFRSWEAEIIWSIIDKVWPSTTNSFLNQSQSSHPISRSFSTNVPVNSVPLNHACQYYDFQSQRFEEIGTFIKLEKFMDIAQFFNFEAVEKNNFEVLQIILICFKMCQDTAGRIFNKFLQAIDWMPRNSNLYLKQVTFLGQMGVSLFLALHRECRYTAAMEVIQAMHKFDINYYSLQKPGFSKPLQNGLFQMSILATANKVALFAIDTCVKVQNPDFAIKILETFNWVRISPDSIAVIAEEEGKLRGTVLLTLVRLLINTLSLSDENNYFVKVDLLCRGVRVICEVFKHIVDNSETIASDDMEDIYNKYVILLLNSGLLDECLDLVNFFSKPRSFVVDLLPEAKRALLVMSKMKGRETRLMFTKLTLEGIYKLPVNNKVVFKSYFTVEEMQLQLDIFLDRLRFIIPKDPTKSFEQKYFLQIVIEHLNKHPCGIHVLEPQTPFYSLDHCLERLSEVLSCGMNPPLEVVPVRSEISSTHSVTDLTPSSIYRYLFKKFNYCDNLIPQYWNFQEEPFMRSSISQPSTSGLQRNITRNPKPYLLEKPTTQTSHQLQNSHTTSTERLRSPQNTYREKSKESSLAVEIETSTLSCLPNDKPLSNKPDETLTGSPPKKESKVVIRRNPIRDILKRKLVTPRTKMLLSSKIASSRSRLNASIGWKTVINDNIAIKNDLNPGKTKPLLRGTNVENGNTIMANISGKTKSFLKGTNVKNEKSSLAANMTNFQVTPLTIPKSPNFSPPVLPNGPLLQEEERHYANKVLPGIRRLSSESGQSSVDLQIVFDLNTNFKTVSPLLAKTVSPLLAKTVSPLLAKSPDFAPPGYIRGKLEKPKLQNEVDNSSHPCQVSDNVLKKIKAFLIVQLQKKHKDKKNLTDGELRKLSSDLAQKFINAVSCKLGLSVLVLNAKVMKELNNFAV